MDTLQQALQTFEEFKLLSNQPKIDSAKCHQLLDKLKLAVVMLSVPGPANPETTKRLLLCRDILEHGAYFSIRTGDIPSFEKFIAQLKTFYYDYRKLLPPSSQEFPLLGLNLLRLLAKNKLDEFHTELELIPIQTHSNIFIKYPIQLEQYMMEGAYNKVMKAKSQIPADTYSFFVDRLMETMRNEIASCCERAYQQLKLSEAQKLLGFSSPNDTEKYAEERNWLITSTPKGEIIDFARKQKESEAAPKTEIESLKLIQQSLAYARELERIV